MSFVCQIKCRGPIAKSPEYIGQFPIIQTMSNDPPTPPCTPDAVQPLRARLSADLLTAMKARDKVSVDTLRCLLAVLDNAGAQDPKLFGSSAEVPRKPLTQSQVNALM